MKYTCCLCGTEYNNQEAAVKCVNKCGRKGQEDGKFISKSAPVRVNEEEVFLFPIEYELDDETINAFMSLKETKPMAFNYFSVQLKHCNTLSKSQRMQIFDMIKTIAKS